MNKGRLEAFSDGIMAVAITIMVLDLKAPATASTAALAPMIPIFLTYVMSFVFVGIYWTNHHHLLQAVKNINGRTLWANLHLMFWLSLTPFTTNWMGQTRFHSLPVALYGVVLLCSGFAYYYLTRTLICTDGHESLLATAIGSDHKSLLSICIYTVGILLAYFAPIVSCLLYALVAVLWLIPDQRIERSMAQATGQK